MTSIGSLVLVALMAAEGPRAQVGGGNEVPPPRTPEGLKGCRKTMKPVHILTPLEGEVVGYRLDVDGVTVGALNFKVERAGKFEGRRATEYRTVFRLDSLIATIVPVEGRAAAIVPVGTHSPVRAMNRYTVKGSNVVEELRFHKDGKGLVAQRTKDNKETNKRRRFPSAAVDFVSGFYYLRSLPRQAEGCAIVYANDRAFTVWLKPEGSEPVSTPIGPQPSDRYAIRFASDRSRRPYEARVWMAKDPTRLPYRAELYGKHKVEARVHRFEPAGG